MEEKSYLKIKEAYLALQRRKSDCTGNSGGAHYFLAYAMMGAGIDVKGLYNDQLEGEAERILCLYGRYYD